MYIEQLLLISLHTTGVLWEVAGMQARAESIEKDSGLSSYLIFLHFQLVTLNFYE